MVEIIGENIDRAATVEMRMQGFPRGIIHKLYDRARKIHGEPLTLLAARRLKESVGANDIVIIATGFVKPPYFAKGEMDGPPGAIALARILTVGLEAKPIILGESAAREPLAPICIAAELPVVETVEQLKGIRHGVMLYDFPVNDRESKESAKKLLDDLEPSAIIAIEKMGPNRKGVIHGGFGADITQWSAKVHNLIEEANSRGILTIGIGDLGNEIGFGVIEDAVRQFVPYGNKCSCHCQGGIATSTKTEVLVVASICNWGGYGIEACLSALLRKPELIHDALIERRILEAARAAGCFGDVRGLLEYAVDCVPGEIQICALEIMRSVVKSGFREMPPWMASEMRGTFPKE